jgi:hypothetical protein
MSAHTDRVSKINEILKKRGHKGDLLDVCFGEKAYLYSDEEMADTIEDSWARAASSGTRSKEAPRSKRPRVDVRELVDNLGRGNSRPIGEWNNNV